MRRRYPRKLQARLFRRIHVHRTAVRFTIFSIMIVLLAIGFSAAVVHENRGVLPYQRGVVFR